MIQDKPQSWAQLAAAAVIPWRVACLRPASTMPGMTCKSCSLPLLSQQRTREGKRKCDLRRGGCMRMSGMTCRCATCCTATGRSGSAAAISMGAAAAAAAAASREEGGTAHELEHDMRQHRCRHICRRPQHLCRLLWLLLSSRRLCRSHRPLCQLGNALQERNGCIDARCHAAGIGGVHWPAAAGYAERLRDCSTQVSLRS